MSNHSFFLSPKKRNKTPKRAFYGYLVFMLGIWKKGKRYITMRAYNLYAFVAIRDCSAVLLSAEKTYSPTSLSIFLPTVTQLIKNDPIPMQNPASLSIWRPVVTQRSMERAAREAHSLSDVHVMRFTSCPGRFDWTFIPRHTLQALVYDILPSTHWFTTSFLQPLPYLVTP